MELLFDIVTNAWGLFLEAAVYVLFGLLVSGVLRVFLSPDAVVAHFGKGRFRSVFKAALFGIPIPLCSCGVLPAAVSMKKQGANNGATTAFLISTPESGVDSIAVSWALLDPLMTVARPVAAFVTALTAGIAENLFESRTHGDAAPDPELRCSVDGCCDGGGCDGESHQTYHTLAEKIRTGLLYAFSDVWEDMAGWFFIGLLLAGIITTLVPGDMLGRYLGGGLPSMVLMLAFGIPLYICATASTPVAAALLAKGVSPGAALVFLLAGPATNMAAVTVMAGVLGKRATAIYIAAISLCSVCLGLVLDYFYLSMGLSATAMVGQAGEFMPRWVQWASAGILLLISAIAAMRRWRRRLERNREGSGCGIEPSALSTACHKTG